MKLHLRKQRLTKRFGVLPAGRGVSFGPLFLFVTASARVLTPSIPTGGVLGRLKDPNRLGSMYGIIKDLWDLSKIQATTAGRFTNSTYQPAIPALLQINVLLKFTGRTA